MFLMWEGIWFQIVGLQSAEGAFAEQDLCPYDNSCVSCGWTKLLASGFFTAKFDHMLLKYAKPRWWRIAAIMVAILNSVGAFTGNQ